MPVISGGGGGNTTAQVAASGEVVPVADTTGVTVDTTTYSNTITGTGKLATLIFPATTGAFAIAKSGDAFPRIVFTDDPTNGPLEVGDGTVDPTQHGAVFGLGTNNGDGTMVAFIGGDQGSLQAGLKSTNVPLYTESSHAFRVSANLSGATLSSGTGAPAIGGNVGDVYVRTDAATLPVYRCTSAGTAGNATWVPVLTPGSPVGIVTTGALSTVQLSSATGAQILTTRDAETVTPCTFNPGAATTATVTVALSPDNTTYSTLGVETEPAGVAFDGTIHLVKVRVPAGWYLKLTVNAQATLGLTTYY